MKWRGFLSVIAGFLQQSYLFSLFVFSNLSVYLISSMHYNGHKNYTKYYGNFFSPVLCFSMTIFCNLNSLIEEKFGHRMAIISGNLIIALCSLALYFTTNFYVGLAIMICYGVGYGFSAVTASKNACRFFPGKEGLVGAIVGGGGNVGATSYILILNLVIMKDVKMDKELVAEECKDYYKKFLLLHMISGIVTTFIVCLLYNEYQSDDDNTNKVYPLLSQENNFLKEEQHFESPEQKTETSEEFSFEDILTHRRIWFLFFIFFISSFGQNFITSTFFDFGTSGEKENLLKFKPQQITAGITVMNFIGVIVGPIWGIIFDMFGFKVAVSLMNLLGCIVSSCFYFSKSSLFAYNFVGVLNGIVFSGVYAMLFPHLMKVYSYRFAGKCYGIVIMATGFSNLSSVILGYFLSKSGPSNYLIAYLIGAGCSVIGLFACLFEGGRKFKE